MRRPLADLPHTLPVRPLDGPFNVTIRPPGSKSITNRALLLAGLAAGESCLRRPLLDADDTERMIAALTALGARFDLQSDGLVIEGVGGRWEHPGAGEALILNLNNAGTATRFLAAAAALADPDSRGITIDGNSRMRQRPIGELVALLRQIGLRVDELAEPGHVPIHVWPPGAASSLNNEVTITPTLSSQFVSALMLTAPFLPTGLLLHLEGPATSQSYVEMTLGLLRTVGVKAAADLPEGDRHGGASDGARGWIRIFPAEFSFYGPGGGGEAAGTAAGVAADGPGHSEPRAAQCILEPFDLDVEPDASAATYFWGAAALAPGSRCRVPGIDGGSIQGDARFVHLLSRMGARVDVDSEGDGATTVEAPEGSARLRGIEADLSRMPDAAMTLAALCCFADGRSELMGLRTLRVKETDRIAALQAELAKIDVRTEPIRRGDDEGLVILPPAGGIDVSADAPAVEFETYEDHRMAMSLALIGLVRPNVSVRDPACVGKTYPGFWRDFSALDQGGPNEV
jgi:3-phosphoshikimate 1-carboxyvinyltransferase